MITTSFWLSIQNKSTGISGIVTFPDPLPFPLVYSVVTHSKTLHFIQSVNLQHTQVVHVFAVRMVQDMVAHTISPAVMVVMQSTGERGLHDEKKPYTITESRLTSKRHLVWARRRSRNTYPSLQIQYS
jgi:hypothetical protein